MISCCFYIIWNPELWPSTCMLSLIHWLFCFIFDNLALYFVVVKHMEMYELSQLNPMLAGYLQRFHTRVFRAIMVKKNLNCGLMHIYLKYSETNAYFIILLLTQKFPHLLNLAVDIQGKATFHSLKYLSHHSG